MLLPSDIARVRELLRRAILTLAAVPDPDLRYRLGPTSAWPDFVRQARDAYGSAPPRVRFNPTPADHSRYLDVLAWLRWYEREYGPETIRLFAAWVFGASMWQLQMRCTTNRRVPATPATVRARMDGLVKVVAVKFGDAIDELSELAQFQPNQGYGAECAETDLHQLPTSPKAWNSGVSEPQTASERAAAVAAQLRRESAHRNRLKRIGRKQKGVA